MFAFNKPMRKTITVATLAAGMAFSGLTMGMSSLPAMAAASADAESTPPQGLSADARATWESIQKFTAEQRDQALAAGERLLNDIDRDLKAVQAKIAESTGAAKDQWIAQEDSLKKARNDFATALDGLRNDAGDSWTVVRKRLSDAYQSIDDGLRKLWEKLKS